MARINIEDKFYLDERFHRLSAFEGKYKAVGLCVIAWNLAHKWFNHHPENLIPFAEWEREPELFLVEKYGLAERKENGVYVKGSKDACEYLTKKSEAGRRGGLKSQENFRSKQKQIEQNQPSYSFSFSNSSSNTISNSENKEKKKKKETAGAVVNDSTRKLISCYCELWKKRYGANPSFSGKWVGNAKTLFKDHGEKKSLELIEAFLEMNDSYFIGRRHPFDMILTDIAKISHFASTGAQITKTELMQIDKTITNKNSVAAAAEYFKNGGK